MEVTTTSSGPAVLPLSNVREQDCDESSALAGNLQSTEVVQRSDEVVKKKMKLQSNSNSSSFTYQQFERGMACTEALFREVPFSTLNGRQTASVIFGLLNTITQVTDPEKKSKLLKRFQSLAIITHVLPCLEQSAATFVQGIKAENPNAAGFNLQNTVGGYFDSWRLLQVLEANGNEVHYCGQTDGAVVMNLSQIHRAKQESFVGFGDMQTLLWKTLNKKNIRNFFPEALFNYKGATYAFFSDNMHIYRLLGSVWEEHKDRFLGKYSQMNSAEMRLHMESIHKSIDQALNFGEETVIQFNRNTKGVLQAMFGTAESPVGNDTWNAYTGTGFTSSISDGVIPSMGEILEVVAECEALGEFDLTNPKHIFAIALLELIAEELKVHRAVLESRVKGTDIEAASRYREIAETVGARSIHRLSSDRQKITLYDTVPTYAAVNTFAPAGKKINREIMCEMFLRYHEELIGMCKAGDFSRITNQGHKEAMEKQLQHLKNLKPIDRMVVFTDMGAENDDQEAYLFLLLLKAMGKLHHLDVVQTCEDPSADFDLAFPKVAEQFAPMYCGQEGVNYFTMPTSKETFSNGKGVKLPHPYRRVHNAIAQTEPGIRSDVFDITTHPMQGAVVLMLGPMSFANRSIDFARL